MAEEEEVAAAAEVGYANLDYNPSDDGDGGSSNGASRPVTGVSRRSKIY